MRFEGGEHFFTEMETNMFFCPPRAPFGIGFGGILEAMGAILGPRGGIGHVLEGSENEVKKREPPKSCVSCKTGGGSL